VGYLALSLRGKECNDVTPMISNPQLYAYPANLAAGVPEAAIHAVLMTILPPKINNSRISACEVSSNQLKSEELKMAAPRNGATKHQPAACRQDGGRATH